MPRGAFAWTGPVLLIALMCVPFPAKAGSDPSRARAGEARLVLALPGEDFEVFRTMASEARIEAAKRHARIEVVWGHGTSAGQVAAVEAALSAGCEGLILDPVDEGACGELLERCRAGATPVVCVDRLARGVKVALHVTADSLAVGRAQAVFLARVLGGHGTVGILGGPAGNSVARAIAKGCMDALRPLPGMHIIHQVGSGWARGQARMIVGGWKAEGQVPDGILAANDALALGALEALGTSPCVVVGADADPEALEAVAAGRLAATVDKSPGLMAREAVRASLRLAAHESVSASDLTGTVAVVDDQPTLDVPCRLIASPAHSRAAVQ